jgi:hypothetical protein
MCVHVCVCVCVHVCMCVCMCVCVFSCSKAVVGGEGSTPPILDEMLRQRGPSIRSRLLPLQVNAFVRQGLRQRGATDPASICSELVSLCLEKVLLSSFESLFFLVSVASLVWYTADCTLTHTNTHTHTHTHTYKYVQGFEG